MTIQFYYIVKGSDMGYKLKIKQWDDINVGDRYTFTKEITKEDITAWVNMMGDDNPVHVEEEYAKTTRFGKIIAPGIMIAGFISTVMTKATFGNVYSGQTLKFLKPVYVGDTITAVGEVIEKLEEKHRVVIKTECFNQNGELVITGEGQEYII